MFGLLEYVTNPNEFINVANNHLKKNGLLVIEVPRANSLSTRVQSIKNPTIVRHMDPTSHINCLVILHYVIYYFIMISIQ